MKMLVEYKNDLCWNTYTALALLIKVVDVEIISIENAIFGFN